ncbi:hypothetical protein [Pseudonocardia sp. GCM10023141]|uniref:hypothetical protein n=1 Tax=Pseudonocardia sp. GCM10023141 TaxID=3252653 RepID=UPI00361C77AD
MSRPEPEDTEGPDQLPSWAGAPGYAPAADDLPPHAPMPGAPPYPAQPELPPPSIIRPATGSTYRAAVSATAIWALVNLVLQLVIAGPAPSLRAFGILLGSLVVHTLLGALLVWIVARRKVWPFWYLVVLALPVFWIIRIALVALVGS